MLNAIYQGYYSVDDVLTDEAESEVDSLQGQIDSLIEDHELDDYIDASNISSALDFIESGHSKIEDSFENFMAYIKNLIPQSLIRSIVKESGDQQKTSNLSLKILL